MKSYRAMIDEIKAISGPKKIILVVLMIMPFGFAVISAITIVKLIQRGSKS